MPRFDLTAQLIIQGPSSSNVSSVLNGLQNQLRGVKVSVNLSTSSAINQLRGINKETDLVSSAVERMGLNFGIALKRFAAFTVAARAVTLLSGNLASAIDESLQFQHQIVRLSQVTGDAVSDLGSLQKQITLLSTSFGISSTEILGVATTLAQAGLNARETTVALTALAKTKLAPSFGDIKQTAEGAIAILAQFGEGAGALERQLGAVNQVAAKFAVESEDLIAVIRTTGGVFKTSGGSLEELLALFTSVRATTRESAESISTGLRTIFTRIQRPDTVNALKKIGVELTDLDGKFVGPYEAVKRLNEALSKLPAGHPQFIKIAEELGGFRQIGKVIPLLQQFELAEKARQVALAGGNSLTKDTVLAQQSLVLQINKVKEEFLALVRGITGTQSFFAITQATLSFASALIKVADAVKPLIPLIGAFAAIKVGQNIGSLFANVGRGIVNGRHGGGRIGFASGGLVPGSGNGDTVPAMLTPGEFVIRKSSVQSIGAANLSHMAKGGKAPKQLSLDDLIEMDTPNANRRKAKSSLIDQLRSINPAADKGALVGFRELRQKYPDLSKEQFDQMILDLSKQGKISLHRTDVPPSSLSSQQLNEYVHSPYSKGDHFKTGTHYVGAAIRRFAGGGSVPSMLTPGEFVVSKSAAQGIGYGNLSSMNRNGAAHFASGGTVGGVQHFAGGGAVGAAVALTVIPLLFAGLDKLVDKTTATGKGLDSLVQNLIFGATKVGLFATLMQKGADQLNEAGTKIAEYDRASRSVNRASRAEDRKFNEINTVYNRLTPNSKARVDEHAQNIRDLAAKKIEFNNASPASGAQLALGNEINDLQTKIARATPRLAALGEEFKKLDLITTTLARHQSALAKLDTPTTLERFTNANSGLIKTLQAVASSTLVVIEVFSAFNNALADFHKSISDENIENGAFGEASGSLSSSQKFKHRGELLGTIGTFAAGGAAAGSIIPGLGTVLGGGIGAAAGLGTGLFNQSFSNPIADKKAQEELTNNIIETTKTKTDLILGNKNQTPEAKAASVITNLNQRKGAIQSISNPIKNQQATQEFNADIVKYAHSIAEQAQTIEGVTKIIDRFKAGNQSSAVELERMKGNIIAVRKALEELTKANLDALRINSVFNKGQVAVENFLNSLEHGATTLGGVINTLEAAKTNPLLSGEAAKASHVAERAVLNSLGENINSTSANATATRNTFGRFRESLKFSEAVGQNIGNFKVSRGDNAAAQEQLATQLKGKTTDKTLQAFIDKKVSEIENLADKDLSDVIKSILKEATDSFGGAVTDFAKAVENREQKLITLTQKRIQLEEQYNQTQKHAIDLQLEAAEAAHGFGAALITPQQKSAARVAQFNVGSGSLGLRKLSSGSAEEIVGAAKEIQGKFTALQNTVTTNAAKGVGSFTGVGGVNNDIRDRLQKKNQELIETTKQQIQVKKEELDLIKKKNQEEKDSLQKLLGGDVEGFLRGQAAAGAASAIRAGNTSLLSSFSPSALGDALKSAQDQGLPPEEIQKFASAALRQVGITDQRSAQVLAGTTSEEDRANREGRKLAGALGVVGQTAANLESLNVNTQDVIINATNALFNNSIKPVGRAMGGLVYASNGFVPRGTDTIPAMLSPNEFVVNSRAVARGNNLQILKKMNGGGGTGGYSNGGMVNYYNGGGSVGNFSSEIATSLSNSLSGFSEAVNKLGQMQISIKLDPTNVNVNFNGISFLQELTDKVREGVLGEVIKEMRNIKFNSAGEVSPQKSVL